MDLLNLLNINSILILLALAGFAYLTWKDTIKGIYLIVLLLPVYLIRPTIASIPTTVLELLILLLFAIWIIKDKRWRHINWKPWNTKKSQNLIPLEYRIPIILFLVAAFIGVLVAGGTAPSLGILKAYFIEPILFLIVLVYELRKLENFSIIFRMLGILTIFISIIAVFQYITGFGIDNPIWAAVATRRVTTLYGYPNAASLLLAPIIALFAGYLFKKDLTLIEKIFSITVITFGILAIIAAKTTGALLALGFIVFLMLVEKKKTRSFGIGIVIIVLVLMLNSTKMQDRFTVVKKNVQENYLNLESSSLEIRINQWRETIQLLYDKPITGAGLTNYQQSLHQYHKYDFLETYLYPHNIILNFWTEIGLLGLIAFIWIVMLMYRNLIPILRKSIHKTRTVYARSLLYALTALLIHGLVDVPYFKNDLSILFMLLLGLSIGLINSGMTKSNKSESRVHGSP